MGFFIPQIVNDAKERLSTVKELGVALYAMVQAEIGTKAVGPSACKAAIKKEFTSPAYPGMEKKAA